MLWCVINDLNDKMCGSEKQTVSIFWQNAAETWIDISSNTADKVIATW